jgi:hypothetical protein
MAKVKIACPKCDWEPHPNDRWSCSCGHSWNTFDTGGRCPACGKVWEHTQCLSQAEGGCEQWSLHLEWYRNLDKWLKEELEKIRIVVEEPVG